MATRVFDLIKFCEPFSKRNCQTGQAVREEKMFKEIVDNTQRMNDIGPP